MNGSGGDRGLVVVFTGDGKGKTTAAIGMGLRATGHNKRVLMIQFVKGAWRSGEIRALEGVPLFDVVRHGAGFTWVGEKDGDCDKHRTTALEALDIARQCISANKHDMIILDEICVAMRAGLVSEDDVLSLIDAKLPDLHVVLTGRGASQKLIDRADLVTVMQEAKHPFRTGIRAQRGIEF